MSRYITTSVTVAFCAAILAQVLESKLVLRNCCNNILTFECTVAGGPFDTTVWRGSVFDCLSEEISLLHSQFTMSDNSVHKSCNNGSIVVGSLGRESGNYTSQLNVTVTPDMIGKSIECIYDAGHETTIGSRNITMLGCYSLPIQTDKVDVDKVLSKGQLTFSWSPVAPYCCNPLYNILASNCGSCPTTTTNTTVTCTDVPTDGSIYMCTFAIQTVVCGDIVGDLSDIIRFFKESDPKLAQCTVVLASTSLLAGISFMYATVLTVIVIVIQRKRRATKRSKHKLPDVLYEDVGPQPRSSTVRDMNTRKNIAYGQVMPPNSINNS